MAPAHREQLHIPIIEHHKSLASTNDEAMRRARQGHGDGLWIVADEQTGGRGRNGRVWASPPGNLYASLLLIDPAPVPRLPELGFVAGVALATTLRDFLGGDLRLKIKWPNDMLHDGAKLSGLMLEGSSLPDGRFACVIGMGVNCLTYPEGLPYRATSLSKVAGKEAGPAAILHGLTVNMSYWLSIYKKGDNFSAVRAAWLGLAAGIGQPIEVALGAARRSGVFSGIDAQGRLILATPDTTETIAAGDVFLPAAPFMQPHPPTYPT